MIVYNYRSRGPYEYDKFILNTFQLLNRIERLTERVDLTEQEALSVRRAELAKAFAAITGERGLAQRVFEAQILFESGGAA